MIHRWRAPLRRWARGRAPDEVVWDVLLQHLPGDIQVVVDLGAAGGEEARFFLEHYAAARVYCFEPDLRSLPGLREIEGERCRVLPVAIGARDGIANFYVSHTRGDKQPWPFSSSLRKPKRHLENWPDISFRREPLPVECRTLDSWCQETSIESIDVVWADIQGAEIDLIEGGQRMLPRTRFLYTEFGDREFYEGQLGLRAIEARLPYFRRVALFENNVLLANRQWPPAASLSDGG